MPIIGPNLEIAIQGPAMPERVGPRPAEKRPAVRAVKRGTDELVIESAESPEGVSSAARKDQGEGNNPRRGPYTQAGKKADDGKPPTLDIAG